MSQLTPIWVNLGSKRHEEGLLRLHLRVIVADLQLENLPQLGRLDHKLIRLCPFKVVLAANQDRMETNKGWIKVRHGLAH